MSFFFKCSTIINTMIIICILFISKKNNLNWFICYIWVNITIFIYMNLWSNNKFIIYSIIAIKLWIIIISYLISTKMNITIIIIWNCWIYNLTSCRNNTINIIVIFTICIIKSCSEIIRWRWRCFIKYNWTSTDNYEKKWPIL